MLVLIIKCYNVIYMEDYFTDTTEIVHCTKEEIQYSRKYITSPQFHRLISRSHNRKMLAL